MTRAIANSLPRFVLSCSRFALAAAVCLSLVACDGSSLPPNPRPGEVPHGAFYHCLRYGEQIDEIARRYHRTPQAIIMANRFQAPVMAYEGYPLLIPPMDFDPGRGRPKGARPQAAEPTEAPAQAEAPARAKASAQTKAAAAPAAPPSGTTQPETRNPKLATGQSGEKSPGAFSWLLPSREEASLGEAPRFPAHREGFSRGSERSGGAPILISPSMAAKTSAAGFCWPVTGAVVRRFSEKEEDFSHGVDIQAPAGAEVRAARSGTVLYIGEHLEGYGLMVILEHTDGYTTIYANTQNCQVRKGQNVKAGQTIAAVGGSQSPASVPLLHFQIRRNAKAVDPLILLPRM